MTYPLYALLNPIGSCGPQDECLCNPSAPYLVDLDVCPTSPGFPVGLIEGGYCLPLNVCEYEVVIRFNRNDGSPLREHPVRTIEFGCAPMDQLEHCGIRPGDPSSLSRDACAPGDCWEPHESCYTDSEGVVTFNVVPEEWCGQSEDDFFWFHLKAMTFSDVDGNEFCSAWVFPMFPMWLIREVQALGHFLCRPSFSEHLSNLDAMFADPRLPLPDVEVADGL